MSGVFTVTIHCDNEVFQPDPGPALAVILRRIAAKIDDGCDYSMFQTILDLNGNDVGRYALKPHSDE